VAARPGTGSVLEVVGNDDPRGMAAAGSEDPSKSEQNSAYVHTNHDGPSERKAHRLFGGVLVLLAAFQRHVDRHRLAVALDFDLHPVAGLMLAEEFEKFLATSEFLAVP